MGHTAPTQASTINAFAPALQFQSNRNRLTGAARSRGSLRSADFGFSGDGEDEYGDREHERVGDECLDSVRLSGSISSSRQILLITQLAQLYSI